MESARNTGNGSGSKSLPGSGDPHVQEVMRAAHEELKQLLRQRGDIMKRIGTVKQTIVGLANLFGDDVLSEELLELVDRKSSGRQPGRRGRARYARSACRRRASRLLWARAKFVSISNSALRRYCCDTKIR